MCDFFSFSPRSKCVDVVVEFMCFAHRKYGIKTEFQQRFSTIVANVQTEPNENYLKNVPESVGTNPQLPPFERLKSRVFSSSNSWLNRTIRRRKSLHAIAIILRDGNHIPISQIKNQNTIAQLIWVSETEFISDGNNSFYVIVFSLQIFTK